MIVNVDTVKIHRALATIVRFAAKDLDSPLCIVRVEGSAGACELVFAATNGHMLARYRLDLGESLDEDVGHTYVAPSVTAAVAAIAPYAKAAEADAKQCSLFAPALSQIDFAEHHIAINDLRAPLQPPGGGESFPPWRPMFERPAGAVQTIGLCAAYVKEIAAAFASVESTAGLYWQFGADANSPTLVRSADVDQLEVILMPLRAESDDVKVANDDAAPKRRGRRAEAAE